MMHPIDFSAFEVGYDIPAKPGMDAGDIQTPALVLDLNALERNIRKMGKFATAHGMRHRAHGKMHKSVDVAKLQITLGGAVGICCQKVSEAEAFARGGLKDILVSNQVRDPLKIDRLARLPKLGTDVTVCVDDVTNVAALSAAAATHGTSLDILVEIDCGAERCGVISKSAAIEIAKAVQTANHLTFKGIQAYQGAMQHHRTHEERKASFAKVNAQVSDTVQALADHGISCEIVSGGGTGSYAFESASGLYNELQCGSYAFMDADYGRNLDASGERLDAGEWQNALFLLTQVMSHTKPDRAIVDAGLKSQSVDSGLPTVFDHPGLECISCSDEHGILTDPDGILKVGDKLRLVPGHCDPTANLHDWYVGVRDGKVEVVWPISARGKSW